MIKNIKQNIKKYKTVYIALLTLSIIIIIFHYYPPDKIVDYVGVENSYLTTFLIAATGGLNSITSGFFYAAVATFSSGGANPWLLGLAGGLGIAIGHSIIFGLFLYGVKDVKKGWKTKIQKMYSYIEKYPSWIIYLLVFLILGFSPLPNDIVLFALVILGFTYVEILPILILAGITITTITALLGQSITPLTF